MNDEEPQTIQRFPEIAKVRIEDRRNPFPMTAVVQVVDFYPKKVVEVVDFFEGERYDI